MSVTLRRKLCRSISHNLKRPYIALTRCYRRDLSPCNFSKRYESVFDRPWPMLYQNFRVLNWLQFDIHLRTVLDIWLHQTNINEFNSVLCVCRHSKNTLGGFMSRERRVLHIGKIIKGKPKIIIVVYYIYSSFRSFSFLCVVYVCVLLIDLNLRYNIVTDTWLILNTTYTYYFYLFKFNIKSYTLWISVEYVDVD